MFSSVSDQKVGASVERITGSMFSSVSDQKVGASVERIVTATCVMTTEPTNAATCVSASAWVYADPVSGFMAPLSTSSCATSAIAVSSAATKDPWSTASSAAAVTVSAISSTEIATTSGS